jgi:hypothetical protein
LFNELLNPFFCFYIMPPKLNRRRVTQIRNDDDEYVNNDDDDVSSPDLSSNSVPVVTTRLTRETVKKRTRVVSESDDASEVLSGVRELELKEGAPVAKKGRTHKKGPAPAITPMDAHAPIVQTKVNMRRGDNAKREASTSMETGADDHMRRPSLVASTFVLPLTSQWHVDMQILPSEVLPDSNANVKDWIDIQNRWAAHNLLFGTYTKQFSTADAVLTIDETATSPTTLQQHRTYVDAVRYGWRHTPDYQCIAFPFAEEKLRQCPPTTKALSLILNVFDIADTISALMFLQNFPAILNLELCLQSPNDAQERLRGTQNIMAFDDVWNDWQRHIQWNLQSFTFSAEIATSPNFEISLSQLMHKSTPKHLGFYTRARFSHLFRRTNKELLSLMAVSLRFVEADVVTNPYVQAEAHPPHVASVTLNIGYTRYFRWNSKFVTPDMTTKWLAPQGIEIFHGPSRCLFQRHTQFHSIKWIRLTNVDELGNILHVSQDLQVSSAKQRVHVNFLAIDETNSWSLHDQEKNSTPDKSNVYVRLREISPIVIAPIVLYLESLTQLDTLLQAEDEWLDLRAVQELNLTNALLHLDWLGFKFRLVRNRPKLARIKRIRGSNDQHHQVFQILSAFHRNHSVCSIEYVYEQTPLSLDTMEMHEVVVRHCALFTPCTSCFGQRSHSNTVYEKNEHEEHKQNVRRQEKEEKEKEKEKEEARSQERKRKKEEDVGREIESRATAAQEERERERQRLYQMELERQAVEAQRRQAESERVQRVLEEIRLREQRRQERVWHHAQAYQRMREAQKQQNTHEFQQHAQAAKKKQAEKEKEASANVRQETRKKPDANDGTRTRQSSTFSEHYTHSTEHTLPIYESHQSSKQKTIEKLSLYLKNKFISNPAWTQTNITKQSFSKFMRAFALITYPDKCGHGPLDPALFTKCERIVSDVCVLTRSQELLDQFNTIRSYFTHLFPSNTFTDKATCAEIFSVCNSIRQQLNI